MNTNEESLPPSLRSAPDVHTWHPDLEILVRENVAFICFDRAASALHISASASYFLMRRQGSETLLAPLREAVLRAFHEEENVDTGFRPREDHRVNDPLDDTWWGVHVVRTHHNQQIAIAARKDSRPLIPEQRKRTRLTRSDLDAGTASFQRATIFVV